MMAENSMVQLHHPEAEQNVIGAVLIDNAAWDRISDLIAPAQFYDRAHVLIMEAAAAMLGEGKPVDVVTLSERLESNGHGDQTGGIAYLATIQQNTQSAANIRRYAEIVADRAMKRGAIQVASQLIEDVQGASGVKTSELLNIAAAGIERLTESRASAEPTMDACELAQVAIQNIDRRMSMEDGEIDGLPTGWRDLDAVLMGLDAGDFVIVAGRPGMGKTVLATNIAEHVGRYVGPAFFFALEMSKTQMADRQVASLAGITLDRVKSGKLDDDDWAKLTNYTRIAKEQLRLYVDFRAGLSPSQIRSRCRLLKRKHGKPAVIVIDYIQLMTPDGRFENQNLAIGSISAALKSLAKEFECPVIALSQLSRDVEKRADKRPLMSDLRDSGSLEQDADVILFPYRDEEYNPDSVEKGTVEIVFGKHRQGKGKAESRVRLMWEGQHSRMRDLAHGWQPAPAPVRTRNGHSGGFDA